MADSPENPSHKLFTEMEVPFALVPELEASAKLERISALIASRLEKASIDAATQYMSGGDDVCDLSGVRPWSTKGSVKNTIAIAEANFYANERAISRLTAHLVQHLVVREDLRSVVQSARRRALDEDRVIPQFLEDLMLGLKARGLEQRDVRYMSQERITELLAVIRGGSYTAKPTGDAPADDVHQGGTRDVDGQQQNLGKHDGRVNSVISLQQVVDPLERNSDEVINATIDCDGGLPLPDAYITPASSLIEPIIAQEGETLSGVVELQKPPVMIATQPVASPVSHVVSDGLRAHWDALELSSLPYEIIDRKAATPEEMMALKFMMPDVWALKSLPHLSGAFNVLSTDAIDNRNGSMAASMIGKWIVRSNLPLSKEEIRLWSFLLVDYNLRDKPGHKTPQGFYHGILMPGPAGSGMIRQLVSTTLNDEVNKNAFRVVHP